MRSNKKKKHRKNNYEIRQRKRMLRKIAQKRYERTIMKILIILILLPIAYHFVVYNILLPMYGKETHAVLAGKMATSWHWERAYNYYYSYIINGNLYKQLSDIQWEDPPIQLGDTIKIIYLESFPSISMRVKSCK